MRRLSRVHGLGVATIRAAAQEALAGAALRELSIVLVDDRTMRALHRAHLGIDGPTDVLAFDLRDDPATPAVEGEVVVSVDTAARQARRFGTTAARELLRYVAHGVLHLVGHDDGDAVGRQQMRREENRVLARVAAVRSGGGSGKRRQAAAAGRTPRAQR